MEKISVYIYLIKDHEGNKTSAVVGDPSDDIQISGIKNKEDKEVYFEGRAYDAQTFCDKNYLALHKKKIELDFDTLWNELEGDAKNGI